MTDDALPVTCDQPDPMIGWFPCDLEDPDHDTAHLTHYSVYKVAQGITEHYEISWKLTGITIGEAGDRNDA